MSFIDVINWLGAVNPLYVVAALAVYLLFGEKIKALFAQIKLPSFQKQHPLASILLGVVSDAWDKFTQNGTDPHDVYVALSNAVKQAAPGQTPPPTASKQ